MVPPEWGTEDTDRQQDEKRKCQISNQIMGLLPYVSPNVWRLGWHRQPAEETCVVRCAIAEGIANLNRPPASSRPHPDAMEKLCVRHASTRVIVAPALASAFDDLHHLFPHPNRAQLGDPALTSSTRQQAVCGRLARYLSLRTPGDT